MKRLGIVLLVMLIFAVASAQTRWEYAHFSIYTAGGGNDAINIYHFEDRTRFAYTGNWEEFTEQSGLAGGSFGAIKQLGLEGYELVSYDREISDEEEIETWYFKRPLP